MFNLVAFWRKETGDRKSDYFCVKQLNIFEQYFLVGKIRTVSKGLLEDVAEDTGSWALELALVVRRSMRLEKKSPQGFSMSTIENVSPFPKNAKRTVWATKEQFQTCFL